MIAISITAISIIIITNFVIVIVITVSSSSSSSSSVCFLWDPPFQLFRIIIIVSSGCLRLPRHRYSKR